MGNMLSTISRVDSKLLHTNCKHSVYMQQRSRIIRQLMIQFILYGSTSVFFALSYYDGTWACLLHIVSQALTKIINRLDILKYVNVVLIVKQRNQKRIYSELHDVLNSSSSRYIVLILLDIITVLSIAVPKIHLAVIL
jgi:hypothetical protein